MQHGQKCEGCGLWGPGANLVSIHVPNGLFCVCPQCLEAVNTKNPELPALRAERDKLAKEVRRLDESESALMRERDFAVGWADKLAIAIGGVEEIGEHSNLNNPWEEAYAIVTPAENVRRLEAATDALAVRPADDGERLAEDWMRSVGFRPLESFAWGLVHCDPDTGITFRLRCEDMPNVATGCAWSLGSLGRDGEESTLIPCSPKTRGDVRRLCAALGIPLGG